jgi:hypothetical protein
MQIVKKMVHFVPIHTSFQYSSPTNPRPNKWFNEQFAGAVPGLLSLGCATFPFEKTNVRMKILKRMTVEIINIGLVRRILKTLHQNDCFFWVKRVLSAFKLLTLTNNFLLIFSY